MPTIIKRGDRWQARVRRKGYEPQSATFRTKAAAERWARGIESGADAGRHAPPIEARRLTLGDAMARYAREVTPHKRGSRREATRIKAWQAHQLADRPIAEIRPADVAAHRDRRTAEGMAPNTVRLELALLSNLFTVARKEWGLAGLPNPVADTRKPSTSGAARTRRLLPGEEARLLWAARLGPRWLTPVVILAIESAMRRGEIAALRDAWVVGDVVALPITKNGQARAVPLSPRALAAMRRIRRAMGDRLAMPAADTITREFCRAARRAGCAGLRFHDLRREAVSRLFERGFTLPEVAAISGHRTWSQLAVYTRPRASDLAAKLAEKKPARQLRAGG